MAPICKDQPARLCIGPSWKLADQDGSSGISLEELKSIRGLVASWVQTHEATLTKRDKNGILLGLGIVELLGLSRLHSGFDADKNGELSQDELLTYVSLDDRPLPKILKDSDAINWDGLAMQFGATTPLLKSLAKE